MTRDNHQRGRPGRPVSPASGVTSSGIPGPGTTFPSPAGVLGTGDNADLVVTTAEMASGFPGGSVVDTFSDASQPQPLATYAASNWALISAWATVELQTLSTDGSGGVSAISTTGHGSHEYWKATQSANMDVWATSLDAFNDKSLWARVQNPTDPATLTGYQAKAGTSGSGVYISVDIWVGGTTLANGYTLQQNVVAGDSWGMRVEDDLVRVFFQASGGSWTELGSFPDTNVVGPGYAGLGVSAAARTVGQFGMVALP